MVGGRSFGTILFYTIAAAEIYSAFAFLGMAGWAFQKGLSITYGMAYMGIAYGFCSSSDPAFNVSADAPDTSPNPTSSRTVGLQTAGA